MKLVSFLHQGRARPGLLSADGSRLSDLSALAADTTELIAQWSRLAPALSELGSGDGASLPAADVELIAPIPLPRRNVFCVGKNYREHAHEFSRSGFDASLAKGDAVPELPIVFTKPPSAVTGPGTAVDCALDPTDSVDYEAELAVVIGRAGRVGASDDPWSFVFGYTLVNDVTSRELQKRHKQWVLGKGIDGFCPMGPAIVTRDEIPDLGAQVLSCHVNGELRQRAPVADLIFDVPTLVRTIGRSISLQPGDVIATGTPAGVGIGFSPPRYLKAGDVVRVEIPAIGVLENRFV